MKVVLIFFTFRNINIESVAKLTNVFKMLSNWIWSPKTYFSNTVIWISLQIALVIISLHATSLTSLFHFSISSLDYLSAPVTINSLFHQPTYFLFYLPLSHTYNDFDFYTFSSPFSNAIIFPFWYSPFSISHINICSFSIVLLFFNYFFRFSLSFSHFSSIPLHPLYIYFYATPSSFLGSTVYFSCINHFFLYTSLHCSF